MARMDAILFDLGGTLAEYYRRDQFPAILRESTAGVSALPRGRGLAVPPDDRLWRTVEDENHESPDHRVRPLEGRLAHIFELSEDQVSGEPADEMCRQWLRPVFARGRVHEDAVPVFHGLREAGLRLGIVSNTPWGSPAQPWREEVRRLRLWDRAGPQALGMRAVLIDRAPLGPPQAPAVIRHLTELLPVLP